MNNIKNSFNKLLGLWKQANTVEKSAAALFLGGSSILMFIKPSDITIDKSMMAQRKIFEQQMKDKQNNENNKILTSAIENSDIPKGCPMHKNNQENKDSIHKPHILSGMNTNNVSNNENVPPAGCPMHKKKDEPDLSPVGGKMGSHGQYQPRDDSNDHYVKPVNPNKKPLNEFSKIDEPDVIPGGRIPATGRGNSSDGHDWVNPTPAELFRALRRNNKIIEEEDAWSVAMVHSMVVDQTWEQILQYEAMHFKKCPNPTLLSFEGKYGHDTIKAKLTKTFIDKRLTPFDRHDWYVDRCGEKVTYIIDYYAVEDPHGNHEYFIDARPAPTIKGMYDRFRMACKRKLNGEPAW